MIRGRRREATSGRHGVNIIVSGNTRGETNLRWVLIRPGFQSPYYDPEIQEPLGIEYLAAQLKQCENRVLVLDSLLDRMDDIRLARRAAAFAPDVIGFSITTANEMESVLQIYREASHRISHRVTWLAGGNYISTETDGADRRLPPEFVLICHEADELVRNPAHWLETEPAEPPAAGHRLRQPIANTPGRGRVMRGRPVRDLARLPFPARPYAEQIVSSGWAFSMQGSRGCCGSCHYCASPGMGGNDGNRWRGRPISHVVSEMAWLVANYGAKSFNFIDEDFLGPGSLARSRATQFADEIKRRNLRIAFSIQVRPASLSDSIIDRLIEAGLVYVFMGIESDDPSDFKRWGRPYHKDPWRWVKRIRSRGAEINAGVLLFHPHSTFDKIRRFATRLDRYNLLEFRSARNRLDAMPGSLFYRQALKTGRISDLIAGPQELGYWDPSIKPFYDDLLLALEPLGPPSMHAICLVPALLSQCRFDPRLKTKWIALKAIIHALDRAVRQTFFSILALHERQLSAKPAIEQLRRDNLSVGLDGIRHLVAQGFAASADELREAIRIDSGL